MPVTKAMSSSVAPMSPFAAIARVNLSSSPAVGSRSCSDVTSPAAVASGLRSVSENSSCSSMSDLRYRRRLPFDLEGGVGRLDLLRLDGPGIARHHRLAVRELQHDRAVGHLVERGDGQAAAVAKGCGDEA